MNLIITTLILTISSWVIGQDPYALNCTYQIIGQDNMVLSAFDQGYPGVWLGKVTTDLYQEDFKQHWRMGNYFGTNLTTLTPERNTDNNMVLTLRPGTSFPLQNSWRVVEREDKLYAIELTLFQIIGNRAQYNCTGCLQYKGPNERVTLAKCDKETANQKWKFSLIRSNDEEKKSRSLNCALLNQK